MSFYHRWVSKPDECAACTVEDLEYLFNRPSATDVGKYHQEVLARAAERGLSDHVDVIDMGDLVIEDVDGFEQSLLGNGQLGLRYKTLLHNLVVSVPSIGGRIELPDELRHADEAKAAMNGIYIGYLLHLCITFDNILFRLEDESSQDVGMFSFTMAGRGHALFRNCTSDKVSFSFRGPWSYKRPDQCGWHWPFSFQHCVIYGNVGFMSARFNRPPETPEGGAYDEKGIGFFKNSEFLQMHLHNHGCFRFLGGNKIDHASFPGDSDIRFTSSDKVGNRDSAYHLIPTLAGLQSTLKLSNTVDQEQYRILDTMIRRLKNKAEGMAMPVIFWRWIMRHKDQAAIIIAALGLIIAVATALLS